MFYLENSQMVKDIRKFPLHLGLGAKVFSEPEFTGFEWYEAYSKRHASDGKEGRLVSFHTFTSSWSEWEMHPVGDELVVCLSGELTLIQEKNGSQEEIKLFPNEYVINPAGVWHTANVFSETSALFITAGEGTQHRKR